MPRASYHLCDVFARGPLTGNQLAVFGEAEAIPEPDLVALAREFNFSEVAFLYAPRSEGDARVRIFTPVAEIPFAGHPLLGSGALVGRARNLDRVQLECDIGLIEITLEQSMGDSVFAWMRQPIPRINDFPAVDELLATLGVTRSMLPVEIYDNGMQHVFVTLDNETQVAGLRPDLAGLDDLLRRRGMHIGVNCFAGAGRRWKTRMFAPTDGVPEDPATGSAAGPLACHVTRYGLGAFDETIVISQGDELGRPSTLHAQIAGTPDQITSVAVGGIVQLLGTGEVAW